MVGNKLLPGETSIHLIRERKAFPMLIMLVKNTILGLLHGLIVTRVVKGMAERQLLHTLAESRQFTGPAIEINQHPVNGHPLRFNREQRHESLYSSGNIFLTLALRRLFPSRHNRSVNVYLGATHTQIHRLIIVDVDIRPLHIDCISHSVLAILHMLSWFSLSCQEPFRDVVTRLQANRPRCVDCEWHNFSSFPYFHAVFEPFL